MVPFELNYTVESVQGILNFTMDVDMLAHFDEWQRSRQDDDYEAQDQWPVELRRARLIPAVDYVQVGYLASNGHGCTEMLFIAEKQNLKFLGSITRIRELKIRVCLVITNLLILCLNLFVIDTGRSYFPKLKISGTCQILSSFRLVTVILAKGCEVRD